MHGGPRRRGSSRKPPSPTIQIVLPRSIPNARNLRPGTEFSVQETAEGILLRPLKPFPTTSVEHAFGSLRHTGKAKTVEEMHEAVLTEAKRRR
jgi:bifunctional DNA-binding transcriptional regulator/antitoxin component of YhaV-PrlF toxin-antitoxin module